MKNISTKLFKHWGRELVKKAAKPELSHSLVRKSSISNFFDGSKSTPLIARLSQ
jgi:hypothetical protein